MSRQYCISCERPLVTCICKYASTINNSITLWILQHPSEQLKTKGTAGLINLSLSKCNVLIGENFSEHEQLNALISNKANQVLLLYPDDDAQLVDKIEAKTFANTHLLVIDGTWKKAYKIYQLSKNIQNLPKVTLDTDVQSQYLIRKHHRKTDLSTLEASCYALSSLEDSLDKYQPLLNNFNDFNQWLLSFRPESHK